MAKKKSKVNHYVQQKQNEAKYKNEYYRRLKGICDLLNPELYSAMPLAQKEAIFMIRGTTVKVTADSKIPDAI